MYVTTSVATSWPQKTDLAPRGLQGASDPCRISLYISAASRLNFPKAATVKNGEETARREPEDGWRLQRGGQWSVIWPTTAEVRDPPGPHPSGFQHRPWPLTHAQLQPRTGNTQPGNASMSHTHTHIHTGFRQQYSWWLGSGSIKFEEPFYTSVHRYSSHNQSCY